jgi:hypothetical protein
MAPTSLRSIYHMRFADGHSTFISHEPPPIQLVPQSPLRGWRSQLLLNCAAGSPIFSIWDGQTWENHQITLQINMPEQPIVLGGILTTNARGLFVFYVVNYAGELGEPENGVAQWLKNNYTFDQYINPFVIRGVPPQPLN